MLILIILSMRKRHFDELRQYINLEDVVEETWDNEPV
jgi:hypothetical protein